MKPLPGVGVIFIRHGNILICTSQHRPGFLLMVTSSFFNRSIYAEDEYQAHEFITRIRKFAEMIE